MLMKYMIPVLLLAGYASEAYAQSIQEILSRIETSQKVAKDISFRLSGQIRVNDTLEKVDLSVKSIPTQGVIRLQFTAPDTLADNIVVADKNEVRQYLYLTNQITVTTRKSAAATFGLDELDITEIANASALLNHYNVKLIATSGKAGQRVYQLEAAPKSTNVTQRTRIWITESGWRPTRIQLLEKGNTVRADLNVSSYSTKNNFTVASIRALPKDAQIVRQ